MGLSHVVALPAPTYIVHRHGNLKLKDFQLYTFTKNFHFSFPSILLQHDFINETLDLLK